MQDSYTSLGQIPNLDTKGWDINLNQVLTPRRGIHPYIFLTDFFFESENQKYACLVYTIVEWTMMSYGGLIAIFEDKEKPNLIVNPKSEWFSYQGDRTLYFINDFLFIRKNAYNQDELLSGTPFVAIDLKNKKFGFIDFDASSIYYSPVHVDDTIYKFRLDTPNEIINSRFINYNGKTFDLATINFYNISDLNNAIEIYRREKAEKIKRLPT